MSKVKNAMGDVGYAIEADDWKALTGEKPESDPVIVSIKPLWSRCSWEYNDEHGRWDTECDNAIALHAGESPFEYGFKFCPYCGKPVMEL